MNIFKNIIFFNKVIIFNILTKKINYQLLLIEEDSSNESNESFSQSSCDCVENCLCNIKQVNVITSEQNFLMELIEKFSYLNLQKEYFKKYYSF